MFIYEKYYINNGARSTDIFKKARNLKKNLLKNVKQLYRKK